MLPRASEPWQAAQWFKNRRSPMPMAWLSAASCFSSIDVKRAYSGTSAARALACSSSYWPVLVQFSVPAAEPKPG